MEFIEKYGKTVEDAINLAVNELGQPKENLEIRIIQESKNGFFGIGARKAIILAKIKKENLIIEIKAREFLEKIISSMNINVEVKSILKNRTLFIDISGDDVGILIGKRGQTLDSLQHIITLVLNKNNDHHITVILDAENYREKRKQTLEKLALNLAEKVKLSNKKTILEPMNNYERKIIHSTLQNYEGVITYSQGEDPNRNVIIAPK